MNKLFLILFLFAILIAACEDTVDPIDVNDDLTDTIDNGDDDDDDDDDDDNPTKDQPYINGKFFPMEISTNLSIDGFVNALAVYKDELYVGGDFSNVRDYKDWNGFSYPEIKHEKTQSLIKFNDTDGYVPMPQAVETSVAAMCVSNNKLFFGGPIAKVAGQFTDGIASWDGNAYQAYDVVNTIYGRTWQLNYLRSIVEFNGKIVMAAGHSNFFVSFNGADWNVFGPRNKGAFENARNIKLCVFKNELYVAFDYEGELYKAVNDTLTLVAKALYEPELKGRIKALHVYKDELIIGGDFYMVQKADGSNMDCNNLAKFDGTAWKTMYGGIDNGNVQSFCTWNDKLIIGGLFAIVGTDKIDVNSIVAWDGQKYYGLGPARQTGATGVNGDVMAMAVYNGDLVVGGNFGSAINKEGYVHSYGLTRFRLEK